MRVLEWNIEIGQHQAFGHERNEVAHMGVGVDVMQPHPSPKRTQITRQIGDMRAVAPIFSMFDVNAIRRGILRDHQQLVHAVLHQLFRLAQDRMRRA